MKIELHEITIRQVVEGYVDNAEEGVIGFGGKLNIRPKYQREYVYDDKKKKAVIESILNGFPLNVMYWAKNGNNFEIIDGQQRTLSFCQFIDGFGHIDWNGIECGFSNLPEDIREKKILDYKLMVYFCEGTDSEILQWFNVININGEPLTGQERRNAVFTGEWLTDAKRHFSKSNCPAYGLASKYMTGTPIRQDYLETAIKWIAQKENKNIEQYMREHQQDDSATELWLYFQRVINWVQTLFTVYRKEMKGIEWGYLYNEYHQNNYNPAELEKRICKLIADDDVQNHKGIYEYLFDGKRKHLNLRTFDNRIKRKKYEEQKGICPHCVNEGYPQTHYEIDEMQADHIVPWHKGGQTIIENCQLLCARHNGNKSGK